MSLQLYVLNITSLRLAGKEHPFVNKWIQTEQAHCLMSKFLCCMFAMCCINSAGICKINTVNKVKCRRIACGCPYPTLVNSVPGNHTVRDFSFPSPTFKMREIKLLFHCWRDRHSFGFLPLSFLTVQFTSSTQNCTVLFQHRSCFHSNRLAQRSKSW